MQIWLQNVDMRKSFMEISTHSNFVIVLVTVYLFQTSFETALNIFSMCLFLNSNTKKHCCCCVACLQTDTSIRPSYVRQLPVQITVQKYYLWHLFNADDNRVCLFLLWLFDYRTPAASHAKGVWVLWMSKWILLLFGTRDDPISIAPIRNYIGHANSSNISHWC